MQSEQTDRANGSEHYTFEKCGLGIEASTVPQESQTLFDLLPTKHDRKL